MLKMGLNSENRSKFIVLLSNYIPNINYENCRDIEDLIREYD